MNKRLGFACKWINDPSEVSGMKINAIDRDLNTGATTVSLQSLWVAKRCNRTRRQHSHPSVRTML